MTLRSEVGLRSTIHGIPVRIRYDGERYFIDDEMVDLCGVGATLAEARHDYWLAVQDAYADLSAQTDQLAPALKEQLAYLQQVGADGVLDASDYHRLAGERQQRLPADLEEAEIDQQFAAMANDHSYRSLNLAIEREFAESDWETLAQAYAVFPTSCVYIPVEKV